MADIKSITVEPIMSQSLTKKNETNNDGSIRPSKNKSFTCEIVVNAAPERVGEAWTTPEEVKQWNMPSSDWHSPVVEIDLRQQGKFLLRMGAKDGSEGFDHAGIYEKIVIPQLIEYTTQEVRKSIIAFTPNGNSTRVTETFEPDTSLSFDMQRDFVQAILENFKSHVEGR